MYLSFNFSFQGNNGNVAVDLMKVGTGLSTELVWGDGTLYSATELPQDYVRANDGPLADIFVNYQGKIDDCFRHLSYTIICQANPLGVEW